MVASPLEVRYFPSPYLAVIRETDARKLQLTLNSPRVLWYLVPGQAVRLYGWAGPRCRECWMDLT
jgi:hypothetical protein